MSDEDILTLSSMHSLTSLTIRNARLSPTSIAYFKRFKKLGSLTLVEQNWTTDDKNKLARLFANRHFEFIKTEKPNNYSANF